MARSLHHIFAALSICLVLIACEPLENTASALTGTNNAEEPPIDSVVIAANNDAIGAKIVNSSNDLPTCDSTALAQLYYLLTTEDFQVCTDTGWAVIDLHGPQGDPGVNGSDGTDGTDGTAGLDGTAGTQGTPGADGINGTNGINGTDGVNGNNGIGGLNGADGVSCSGTTITEGIEITCGGVIVDTIVDGTQGIQGEQGNDGTSCSVQTITEGAEVSCGGIVVDTITNGEDGNTFHSGEGVPSAQLGKLGDTYLDYSVNIYFKKEANGWEIKNISTAVANGHLTYLRGAGITAGIAFDNGAIYKDLLDAGYQYSELTSSGVIGTITDTRDGEIYPWVKIGSQKWMSSNLNYSGHNASNQKTLEIGNCYGVVNHQDSSTCYTYGRLYTWSVAMNLNPIIYDTTLWDSASNQQGICPSGWHVPQENEWETLANYVAAKTDQIDNTADSKWDDIGTNLKSSNNWFDAFVGTDDFGFNAQPGGYGQNGNFGELRSYGNWWTSTEDPNAKMSVTFYLTEQPSITRSRANKPFYSSLRCLKYTQ